MAPTTTSARPGCGFDTKDGAFTKLESGSIAIVPGKPEESELIDRIDNEDPELRMPPAKSGKKLTAAQIAILRRWVEQGAKTSSHWAFEPPVETRCAVRQERELAEERRSTASSWRGSKPRGSRLHPRPRRRR